MKRTVRNAVAPIPLVILTLVVFLLLNSSAVSADWTDWQYSAELEITNNATSPLPAGYTTSFQLDTASLISQGQMQSDCDDLRVAYWDGATEIELDRLVTGCDTSATSVTLRTEAEIGVAGSDADYVLYYGNALATDPPEDRGNVYAFYDGFDDGLDDGWVEKGTWDVVDDGGNYIYRYTTGGAVWALAHVSLPGVSDLEYVARMRADTSTTWIGLAFRIQDEDNFLTFYQSRDTSEFKFARIVSDDHQIQEHPSYTMGPGSWYWLRLQAIGGQVRARIWQDGDAEPTTWLIDRAETTFQSESNVGATLYNHTTVADWDDFQVRKLVDSEPTVVVNWPVPWWDSAWGYRLPLTVTNTAAETLEAGYSVQFSVNSSVLIGAGQMIADCDDLRVVSFDGATNTEIDRVVENCGSDETRVWFSLQRPIGASGEDGGYYLYYGNPAAGAPPADEMAVFLFYEDWEQGTGHWIGAGGLDPSSTGTMGLSLISDLEWVSAGHSQQFPVKVSGGDAFSGYIPVSASTDYALGVWAKASEAAYAPVGFDPYTDSYVQGTEVWLWTNEWTIGTDWSHRNASFTTGATTAYIKIKSEWWTAGPGTEPVYMDNLWLRLAASSDPTVVLGEEETILPVPVIVEISDTGPVVVGTPITMTAVVSATAGSISTVTLQIESPESGDVPMTLVAGDVYSGTWEEGWTPAEGGVYSYRILATSSVGPSTLSEARSFTATDTLAPQISLVSVTDPILVKNTQTLTVTVTDNGQVQAVNLDVEGESYPMTQSGDGYAHSWRVMTVGTITYTVTATDTVGNSEELTGTFESLAREVDVCTWYDCKSGAASFSVDDGSSSCRPELEAAGFRGTYYYNGNTTQSWFSTYSAAGHEIGSHSVGHPCDAPCCYPDCTPESIWECPYTTEQVEAYRSDQLEPNIAAIEAGTGLPVVSMAWPCGCADARRMTAASYYFLGVRGYHDYIAELDWVQDVNEPTPVEFMNLNSANSYNQTFIDQAVAEGKWAIITSHGSCAGIDYMGSLSDTLWLAPVGTVLKYIKIRDAATYTNYEHSGRTISFDALHTLAPFTREEVDSTPMSTIDFDDAVTLQVHVLESDEVLGVEVDGAPVSYTVRSLDGTQYVLFDSALDATKQVTVTLAEPAPTIEAVIDNSTLEIGGTAQVTATVTLDGGTVQTVTLRLLSPVSADYPMTLVTGTTDQYEASFVPTQVTNHTYRVLASNDEGRTNQSTLRTLVLQDTVAPSWQGQSQAHEVIAWTEGNTLTVEALDIGGLVWAVLATDESGSWQEFDWSVTDWWDHDWSYRRPITMTETAGLARTAETVDLLISDTEFVGLTDCAAELRVADAGGTELPVQVYDESSDGGVLTCRLLFQVSVGANASQVYYIYYGNPSATPPSYATDLISSTVGGVVTVENSFFEVDLDSEGGVISRLLLPAGSDTNLPLSPESDSYWGWHQVCSSLDGNITGKNSLCEGGTAPATGLVLATSLDGPIAQEFTLTSIKTNATYTITYRFLANAPYYQYTLERSGDTAEVMNNFWYANGNFARLGAGSGGTPATDYNTYSYGADQVRLASFAAVDQALIDGLDNDGTHLGGTDYRYPSAAGLELHIATGGTQGATEEVLGRVNAPLAAELGASEDRPEGQYGSPMELGGVTGWTSTSFVWQPSVIPASSPVHWRVRYCDVTGNCTISAEMSFTVTTPTAVGVASFEARPEARLVQALSADLKGWWAEQDRTNRILYGVLAGVVPLALGLTATMVLLPRPGDHSPSSPSWGRRGRRRAIPRRRPPPG